MRFVLHGVGLWLAAYCLVTKSVTSARLHEGGDDIQVFLGMLPSSDYPRKMDAGSGAPPTLKHELEVLASVINGVVLVCHPLNHTCTKVGHGAAVAHPYRPSFGVLPWSQHDFPVAVVLPITARDVQKTVRFVKVVGLQIAVKGGGHHGSAAALSTGSMLLDLHLMAHISVDIESGTVSVGAGATLGQINDATLPHGLHVPLGWCYSVGQGYSLHGGVPITPRQHGLSVENIVALNVVTAEGELVQLSEDACSSGSTAADHCGLLWAVKGQASAFAIVTDIMYKTHKTHKFTGGSLTFVDNQHHDVLKRALEYMLSVVTQEPAADITISAQYDAASQQHMVAAMILFNDGRSTEQQRSFLHPLLELKPIDDTLGQMTYENFTQMVTPELDEWETWENKRLYWTSGGVKSLEDARKLRYVDTLVDDVYANLPHGEDRVIELDVYLHREPGSDRLPPVGIARLLSSFFVMGVWPENPDSDATIIPGMRAARKKLHPKFTEFQYANAEILEDSGATCPDLVAFVGGKENWQRICLLKRVYDREDVFQRHLLPGLNGDSCKTGETSDLFVRSLESQF